MINTHSKMIRLGKDKVDGRVRIAIEVVGTFNFISLVIEVRAGWQVSRTRTFTLPSFSLTSIMLYEVKRHANNTDHFQILNKSKIQCQSQPHINENVIGVGY